MAQFLRKLKRALFNYDPSFCDMYEDARAKAAATEYLGHIQHHIREQFGEQPLTILDAGCQAGRFLIPLAQQGHRLIGVDTSGFALRRTRQHAKRLALSVDMHEGNIAHVRRWVEPHSVDVVLCLEVLYLCENYRELLRLLAESLRPGGLLCVSHRPPLYYVASALRRHKPKEALAMLQRSEGLSPDGAYHNWQDQTQLMEWYRREELKWLACYPVDHVELTIEPESIKEPLVLRAISGASPRQDTIRVPSYLLAIAQQPGRPRA